MKIIFLLFACFLLAACDKNNDPGLAEIFTDFGVGKKNALADGSTEIRAFCKLNPEATIDRRDVKFTISAGQFVSNKEKTVVQKCQFVNDELLAEVFFQVPLSGTSITVTAQPNIPDIKNNKYSKTETVTLDKSVPATLVLTANSNSIASNYEQEILLTATLRNSLNGKISSGYKVGFESSSTSGKFRAISDQVNSDGVASAIYSAGAISIGQQLKITCYLLDEAGNRTLPENFVNLYINK
jgi:hypothetical protein